MLNGLQADECGCGGHSASPMLSVHEAASRARALAKLIGGPELAGLADAAGRVLATNAHAPAAMPFFDNSAMDGFALCFDDLAGGGQPVLPVCGEMAAGENAPRELQPGTCMRIFTGARLPEGADTVVPVEQTLEARERVTFGGRLARGSNIRPRGGDIERNALLVAAGTRLSPRHLGLLAANGFQAVNVRRRPRAAVFSTGDELAEPGRPIRPGQIYDCNRPMLAAMLAEAGCEVADLGAVRDDPLETQRLLKESAGRFDLLVSSGSVSVGERDFLKAAFVGAGGVIDSWKVAVKPGKPVLMGRIGESVFLGLPGNPYAAWIGMHLFIRPVIAGFTGETPASHPSLQSIAAERIAHRQGREEYVPVRLERFGGELVAHRIGKGGSASLFPLAVADALAVIPASWNDAEPGAILETIPICAGAFQ